MAKRYTYVHGLDKVLVRIHKEMMAVRGRTYKGMYAALRFLEYKMDTENPVVPLSNLKNKLHLRETWYIEGNPDPISPTVWAGYTAPYAEHVHENLGAVNWTRPGSGPKWLQIHYDRNRTEMLMIVAQHARVIP